MKNQIPHCQNSSNIQRKDRSKRQNLYLPTYMLNCVPLLVHVFLYSYETDVIQGLLMKNEKKFARPKAASEQSIENREQVRGYNCNQIVDFVDIIYPIELEIKNASDSVSYLGLHLEMDSDDRLKTQLYDKRDDFNFPIVNFPFICSNIPTVSTY